MSKGGLYYVVILDAAALGCGPRTLRFYLAKVLINAKGPTSIYNMEPLRKRETRPHDNWILFIIDQMNEIDDDCPMLMTVVECFFDIQDDYEDMLRSWIESQKIYVPYNNDRDMFETLLYCKWEDDDE